MYGFNDKGEVCPRISLITFVAIPDSSKLDARLCRNKRTPFDIHFAEPLFSKARVTITPIDLIFNCFLYQMYSKTDYSFPFYSDAHI